MNKKISLLTALVAVGVLATGCGKDDGGNTPVDDGKIHLTFEGGTEIQQKKITSAVNGSICQINGSTTALGKRSYDLVGDENNYIVIANTFSGVKLEWSIDETQPAFRQKTLSSDGAKTLIELNYPTANDTADLTFTFNLTKAFITNGAYTTNDPIPYTFNVKRETLTYDVVRIHDMVKMNDQNPDQYDILGYEDPENPFFVANNTGENREHKYVITYGTVTYLAPDGNWGLLAEGDDVMEFYAGSSTREFKTAKWPDLAVGNKVLMAGNMSQYLGNIQLAFVTRIEKLPQGISVVDPTNTYGEITATDIAAMKIDTDGVITHKQNIAGYMNQLKQFTGKIKENAWYTQSGSDPTAATKFEKSLRNFFTVQVGTEEIQVAYDYHITSKGTTNADITAMFDAIYGQTSKTFTFKGTLRYSGQKAKPFAGNKGVWQLVPFSTEHIVEVQ